jgi:hypothetical protein
MDILNFISWIKGNRVVTSVDSNQTLIPVGLKDNRRGDGYIAGAITVEDLAAQLSNSNQVLGLSTWANKFTPVGCINEDITLPASGNFTYPTPLAMCVGKTLTIPVGTTLSII